MKTKRYLLSFNQDLKSRRYYTDDNQFFITFGQQTWKVTDLRNTSGKIPVRRFDTLAEVKAYLRKQHD